MMDDYGGYKSSLFTFYGVHCPHLRYNGLFAQCWEIRRAQRIKD